MKPTNRLERLRAVCDALGRKARKSDVSEEDGEEEAGFTLIELMVVLLIMAILLAIAIPTFLSVKGGAQDRASQSNLTNAITAAKAYYTNAQTYGTATGNAASLATALSSSEPEFTWTAAASTSQNEISVAVSTDGNVLVLAVKSASGRCWYAEDNEETAGNDSFTSATTAQGVTYNEQTSTNTGTNGCNASLASATLVGWSASYPSPS